MELHRLNALERDQLDRTIDWLAIPWSDHQTDRLLDYRDWLASEALTLGGIGPGETPRLWGRHILDSLLFGRGLVPGSEVLDVGSGIGLPGIPLLVAFPESHVSLLDRSGRRIDALHRVARLLGVEPTVLHNDVSAVHSAYDRLVLRASLRLPVALAHARRLLRPEGEAWFGLGRGEDAPAVVQWRTGDTTVPDGLAVEEVHVPAGVLDSGVWLLRIARQ